MIGPGNNMQKRSRRKTLTSWEEVAREIQIPPHGLKLDEFSAAMLISPTVAYVAAKHLHRKKIIRLAQRNRHSLVFPANHELARGRPPATATPFPAAVDPKLFDLFSAVAPAAVAIAVLNNKMPTGPWNDQINLRTELVNSIRIEAANIAATFRKFVGKSGAVSLEAARQFLWVVFPEVLPVVVRTEADLQRGEAPLTPLPKASSNRVPPNLPDRDRFMAYVEMAGRQGIGLYEIVRKTGGAITRERGKEIGEEMESSGFVYVAEKARTSNRGNKGIRYFSCNYGPLDLGSDGRRLPDLSLPVDEEIKRPWLTSERAPHSNV
jgi:hypothetical protein